MSESSYANCLDSETVATIVAGGAPDDELETVSRHLLECERCYQKLAAAAQGLAARHDAAIPSWPLLPALGTAVGIALALTLALLAWLSGSP